jgi:hypothetical protein
MMAMIAEVPHDHPLLVQFRKDHCR